MEAVRVVTINGCNFEVTEDTEKIYYEEISNRANKAHFSFSKKKEENVEAEYGLKTFWTEVFS